MISHRPSVARLLASTALAAAVAQAQAPPPPDVYMPVNLMPVKYTGDHIEPHQGGSPVNGDHLQRYNVFLPADLSMKPVAGWPVLIHFDLSGFLSSTVYTSIVNDALSPRFSDFLWEALARNIAVITVTATPSGNVLPQFWNPDSVLQKGEGRLHPPGHAACFDYFDPDMDCAEKDAIMIIQHVRQHAGDPNSMYKDHMQDLDRTRIAVHGDSAGAIALMWPTFGPERRDLFDTPQTEGWTDQYNRRTRPDVAILRQGVVWWPAQLTAEPGHHFSTPPTPDPPPPGCIAATFLDQAEPGVLQAASALFYEDLCQDPPPTFLYYKEMYNLNLACLGQPTGICAEEDHSQVNVHSLWHGLMWWARHKWSTVLAIATHGEDANSGTPPGTLVSNIYISALGALFDAGLITDPLNQDPHLESLVEINTAPPIDATHAPNDEILDWLVERFEEQAPNPWTELWARTGPPPAGPPGTTAFRPNGELDPGCNILLPISSASPGTGVELWIAAWPTTLVDNGCGEVIANPDLVIPLLADGTGRLTYVIRWEELPSQVANVFQVIVPDSEEPCGYSITETWIADTTVGN